MYRAYIAQNKFSIVLNEINVYNAESSLKAVRRLAEYLSSSSNRLI